MAELEKVKNLHKHCQLSILNGARHFDFYVLALSLEI